MDRLLRRRVLGASVGSASVVGGGAIVLSSGALDGLAVLSLVIGMLVLGPAHLLRAAAVLRRGPAPRAGGLLRQARGPAVALLSVAMTALAVALFAAGFGGADDDAQAFGGCVGVAALARLWEQGALQWPSMPREAAHRRLKSRLFGTLCQTVACSAACVLLVAWSEGALFSVALRARLLAGTLVFLAGEAHVEALQGCTSLLTAGELPRGAELAEALIQPLSTMTGGPGLGRWLALTALAQAAAHRQPGPLSSPPVMPGAAAGGSKVVFGGPRGSLPPLATEVFGLDASSSRVELATRLGGPATFTASGRPWSGAPNQPFSVGAPTWGMSAQQLSAGLGGSAQLAAMADGGAYAASFPTTSAEAAAAMALSGRGLFATYLASGLEVLREFSVRVHCLVAAARLEKPDTLQAAQVLVLDAAIVELLPLMRVSAVGLAGWICLSRDLDAAGVVQREEALRKVLFELCGVLCAVQGLWPLSVCGALELTPACAAAGREAQEEARHSLEQLLLSFEHAGLRQVSLPAQYRRLIMELSG